MKIEKYIPLLLFVVIFACFYFGVNQASDAQRAEALKNVRDNIVRAAVSCYAIEGFYPPDVDYLREHYNLYIDDKKYAVFYEIFSSNICPDVDVIAKSNTLPFGGGQ